MSRAVAMLALAVAIACAACAGRAPSSGDGDDAQPTSSPSVPVGLGFVRRERVEETVSGYGTVAGGRNAEAALAFPQPGRIAAIDVSIGERVAKGAALATLDAAPLVDDLGQARAALAAAEANANKVSAGARPQQVRETSAQIEGARAQLALARSQLARERVLLHLGVAAAADVETARAAEASAEAALAVLEAQRSSETAPAAPDVAVARANVSEARVAADAARAKIDLATLRAPFAGTIVAVSHSEGEIVDPASPVVSLVGATPQIFTAQFAPADAQRIAVGDAARIVVRGAIASASARVVALDPQQTQSHTIAVLLRIEPSGALAFGPGAYGRVSIEVGASVGLVVASSAIVADPTTGAAHVFRKRDDRYEAVPVDVERDSGRSAWVDRTSLHAGDRIVTSGAYSLER